MPSTIKTLMVCLLISWSAAWAAVPTEPQELIQYVANQTLERIKKEKARIKANPSRINALVDELILPHFDFERMSRWVLGKYWRKATADQKKRFVAEFKDLLIRTYGNSLLEYSDQKITYLPFRNKPGATEVTVRSEVEQPGGFPIPINYRLYKKGNEWKVYDVVIDDVSLIANYRTSFSREIRKSSLEHLIETLAEKNTKSR